MAGNYQQPMTGDNILCALFGKGWTDPNAIQNWNRQRQQAGQTTTQNQDQILADVVLFDVDKHEGFVAWNRQLMALTGQNESVMAKEGGLARVGDIPTFQGYARYSLTTNQLIDINHGQPVSTATREAVSAGAGRGNSP